MTLYQAIPLIVALTATAYTILLLKKKRVREKYAWTWLTGSVGLLVISIYPAPVFALSNALGFRTPSNMLLSGAILFLLALVAHLSVELSALEHRCQRLAEETAILRHRVEQLSEKLK